MQDTVQPISEELVPLLISEVNRLAQPEGWFISHCMGLPDEEYRIERRDEEPIFSGDTALHQHLMTRAKRGDPLAKLATQLIYRLNLKEYVGMVKVSEGI